MKFSLKPGNIAQIRGHGGWAAVFFGEAALDLTISRGSGNNVDIQSQISEPLPSPEETPETKARWQAAVEKLRAQVSPREHRIVTAMGCEEVLCQTLRLPTTQSGELQQMLDLQIDGLSPFPLEEAVYSFEALEKTENETRVLVAVARRATVNERVEVLEKAGLPPEVVGIDALAVFRSFVRRNLLPVDDKLNAFVQVTPTVANVIVYTQSVPVTIRSLLLGEGLLGSAENRAALRDELQRTLVAAQAEQAHRQIGLLTLATWSEKMRAEVEEMSKTWNGATQCYTNGSMPTPGASLCAETASSETARLNLLPEEWRRRRRTAQMRKRLVRGGIAVAALYLLLVIAFLSMMAVQQARLSAVNAEISKRQKAFADAQNIHQLLETMQRQLDKKYSVLEVMRAVCELMPDTVKLNAYSFKKDDTVVLKAQAQSATVGDEFISQLEKCPLFSKIAPGPMRTDAIAGGLTKFDVVCTLKSAPAAPAGNSVWH